MFYYLSQWLLDQTQGTPWETRLSFLRLFRYITVRSAGAAVTALTLSWWLGPKIIRWLKQLKFGQDYADRPSRPAACLARAQQKRHPDHGRGAYRGRARVFHPVLGPNERPGGTDPAVGLSPLRPGLLR